MIRHCSSMHFVGFLSFRGRIFIAIATLNWLSGDILFLFKNMLHLLLFFLYRFFAAHKLNKTEALIQNA